MLSDKAVAMGPNLLKISSEKNGEAVIDCEFSSALKSTPGNFTDNTTSNRAEELLVEITSCSFAWNDKLQTLVL